MPLVCFLFASGAFLGSPFCEQCPKLHIIVRAVLSTNAFTNGGVTEMGSGLLPLVPRCSSFSSVTILVARVSATCSPASLCPAWRPAAPESSYSGTHPAARWGPCGPGRRAFHGLAPRAEASAATGAGFCCPRREDLRVGPDWGENVDRARGSNLELMLQCAVGTAGGAEVAHAPVRPTEPRKRRSPVKSRFSVASWKHRWPTAWPANRKSQRQR